MTIRVFVQNEAGSTQKRLYDEKRLIHLRTVEVLRPYPFPYGFVIGTTSDDGDNLDCFVLTIRPLTTGTIVDCAPVALLEQIEDGAEDHNVLAIPVGEEPVDLESATVQLRAFIAHVFDHVPGKAIATGRLLDATAAEHHIKACLDGTTDAAVTQRDLP